MTTGISGIAVWLHKKLCFVLYAAGLFLVVLQAAPIGAQTASADLLMTSIAGPASAWTGGTITVTHTVTAAPAGGTAGAFNVGIYLSSSSTITTANRRLGSRRVGGLAPGASVTDDTTVTLPVNIAPGTYYLGAIADFGNTVSESDETNNTLVGNQIVVAGPDLTIAAVSGPASGLTGGTITVFNTVTASASAGASRAFNVGIYLSSSSTITTANRRLGSRHVSGLAPGESSTDTTALTLPVNIAPGTYYLGAIADFGNTVSESDETNNTLVGSQIVVGGPDLTMTAVSGPARAWTGGTITVTNTATASASAGASRAFNVGIYLSPSNTITTANRRLGFRHVDGLAPGALSTDTTAVTLPVNIAPGTYYLGAIADFGNTVSESDETNNALAGSLISIGTDTTPPVGSILINGGAAATNLADVTLTAIAADTQSGLTQMQFSTDNVTWPASEPYATTKNWTLTPGDGPKTIYARYQDAAGNWSVPSSSTIVLDTIAPIVAITSPVAGVTSTNTPLLSYMVSEGSVTVRVDGHVVSKTSGTTLEPLTEGQHAVIVEATDAAGNVGFAEVSITVAVVPIATVLSSTPSSPDGENGWFKTTPSISLTRNAPGTTYYQWGSEKYSISRSAREWVGGGAPLNIRGDDTGGWHTLPFSFTFYGVSYDRIFISSNGLISFDSENTDYYDGAGLSGRVAIAPLWDDLRTDVRPGDDIYVFHPDGNSIGFRWQAVTYLDRKETNFEVVLYRDGKIRFNYGAQAGVLYGLIGISQGDGITTQIAYDGTISGTNYADSIAYWPQLMERVYSGPFTALAGEHVLYYYSVDQAGNVESTKNQVFRIDAAAPTVNISSPLTGFTNNTTPRFKCTISEAQTTLTVMVDGQVVDIVSGDLLGPLSKGPHTVRVDVSDRAGNAGSAEVAFTVISDAPSVNMSSPVPGITTNNRPTLNYTVNYGMVRVTVDGAAVNKSSGDTLDLLADGYHTVRVESLDASGYVTFAEAEFIVDVTPPRVSTIPGFTKISAGYSHNTALTSDGNMWWWGNMTEFGYANTDMPRAIGTSGAWTAIASGFEGSLALRSDGSLWGWGRNPFINISNYDGFTPSRIGLGADGLSISAQGSGATMLVNDGSLWVLERTFMSDRLGQIGSDANWIGAATGDSGGAYYGMGLKSDNTLWIWGSGFPGQESLPDIAGPLQIGSDTNWSAVSAGRSHALALKSDGTLWAWGDNSYGQLGNGSGIDHATPIQVGADADWSAISAGKYHTVALKTNGTLWAWGANGYGQVGDGSEVDRSTPVRIGSDANWSAISAGGQHTIALKSDGSLWTWGINLHNDTMNRYDYRLKLTSPHALFSFEDAIVINNGIAWTNNPFVTLDLDAWDLTSGVASMQLSNDGLAWSLPEPYGATKSWMLAPGNGVKTVFVRFQDEAGNWSSVYSASINLVEGAPDVAISSPASGLTKDKAPLLLYTVSEGSVVVKVDGVAVNTVSGNMLAALPDGSHMVRVEATNAFGTGYAEVALTVDTAAPMVTIVSPVPGTSKNRTPTLSYSVSDGDVIVMVDGQAVTSGSGQALSSLADGRHVIKVRSTDAAGNTGAAQVSFVVDNTPPTIYIESPVEGLVTTTSIPVVYGISDGTATATIDGAMNISSGSTLSGLSNGSHILTVSATDVAGNTGSVSVTFMVDNAAAGNDDANIYCSGTGTYIVGASNFTSGIPVPVSGNSVFLAAPSDGATITGATTIVKGAMDTTVPVNSVMIVVTSGTATRGYPAQVNGKYFAAKVPVSTDTIAITAIATDRTGAKHQANASVSVTGQASYVDLQASPSIGIPVPKQNGPASLDVRLTSSASTTHAVINYAWDLDGSGTDDVTCYSRADVAASYQHTGLYLAQVSVTDTTGNKYADTAIVNVLDRDQIDGIFKPIWNGMKEKLGRQDVEGALVYYHAQSRDRYRDIFTALSPALPAMIQDMQDIEIVYVNDNVAKYRIRKTEMYGGQLITLTYYIYFLRDESGTWAVEKF